MNPRILRAAAFLTTLWLVACSSIGLGSVEHVAEPASAQEPVASVQSGVWAKPSDSALREKLTPMQYQVTQNGATEPPFQNAYWDEHREGLYVDVVTGEPLFSSADKFDSGTGWPSFVRPIEPERVTAQVDTRLGFARVEVLSSIGRSHLGHVFDDGPVARGGKRYCMNSAALRFIPYEALASEGYGAWMTKVRAGAQASPIPADHDNTCVVAAASGEQPGCATSFETAVLAGGCFWGMEDILRDIPGVVETEVGYTGGHTANPTYLTVHTGTTGHAEAVRVVFDPAKLSFEKLLEDWFFHMHDPTTRDQQGNDVGSQYRSAIFAQNAEQAKVARAVIARVGASGLWRHPIVTTIEPAGVWTPAESYHQDYLEKNPDGYTCHFMR